MSSIDLPPHPQKDDIQYEYQSSDLPTGNIIQKGVGGRPLFVPQPTTIRKTSSSPSVAYVPKGFSAADVLSRLMADDDDSDS